MAVFGLRVHVLPDLLLGSEDAFNSRTCKNNVLLLLLLVKSYQMH